MSREIMTYQIRGDLGSLLWEIDGYLGNEGYVYETCDGEDVYRLKGSLTTPPTYFKMTYEGNVVRIESWMKFQIVYGIYVGEYDLQSKMGAAVKGAWRNRVYVITEILARYGAIAMAPAYAQPQPQPVYQPQQPQPQQTYQQPQQTYQPQGPVSRREFRKHYLPLKHAHDIRNIAIVAYVLVGIAAIGAILTAPSALLDAAIFLGLTLGMHLGRSKGCAIAILVGGCAEFLYACINGSIAGYLWVILGILAVVTFHKIDKEYDLFLQQSGGQQGLQ